MPHADSVTLDIVGSLLLCAALFCRRYFFGSTDADGTYRLPQRKLADAHIEEVIGTYNAVLNANPTSDTGFTGLPRAEQERRLREYAEKLTDAEYRVRAAHSVWGRRSPI